MIAFSGRVVVGSWVPEVCLDGCWRSASGLPSGVGLRESHGGGPDAPTRRLRLENASDAALRLDGFRWRRDDGGAKDFLSAPGGCFRVYLEGWGMTTPCGSVRLGDHDFRLNPEYKPFALPAPDGHDDTVPNVFRAENLVAIQKGETDETLVAGFITSADQFGRFALRLETSGVAEFTAICDTDRIEVPPGTRWNPRNYCSFSDPMARRCSNGSWKAGANG